MNDFSIIFNHELKSLIKSTKSTILSLVLVSFFWGIFFSFNVFDYNQEKISAIWLILFAFVASSGFANASFARERLVGSWEILLASGVSREIIFWAKLIFVQAASFFCGTTTLLIAFLIVYFVWGVIPDYSFFLVVSLFFCAALSINVFTAYFTIINVNQRAAQLINMGIMSVCSVAIYFVPQAAIAIVLIPAIFILLLCRKILYRDETILPIVY
jgi:ABC-type Na+ efflux pump permease subunit